MLLAADVGGTKANLALYDVSANSSKRMSPLHETQLTSSNYQNLSSLLLDFLNQHTLSITTASIAVAGYVSENRVITPNLSWEPSSLSTLTDALNVKDIYVINDLYATAMSLPWLERQELACINVGKSQIGNKTIIAPGTGLGESLLVCEDENCIPVATEGGHGDFAPTCEEETELLCYLWKKFHHVSYERILSGPGIVHIYDFYKSVGQTKEPEWLLQRFKTEDPAAVIFDVAEKNEFQPCQKTFNTFTRILGAEAGNLVLKYMAVAGVYIGGGIAPKIVQRLKTSNFMPGFCNKGRYEEFMQKIPVHVILNANAALLGACRYGLLKQK